MGVTIRDIAKEAGVSISTVSRIINGNDISIRPETRQRVESVVNKYHYSANKGTKKNDKIIRREQIAVVVPDLKQMFFTEIVEQVEKYCTEHGLMLTVCNSRNDIEIEKEHIRRLIGERVKGIIYLSIATTVENGFEDLKKAQLPFVVLDSNLKEYNVPGAAFVDGEIGVYQATKYLIENGHKRIAYITGVEHAKFNNNRHQGYVRALLEANLLVDPEMTIFGTFTFESGAESIRKLEKYKKQYTAIVCENDLIAIGAMRELERNGLKIPDDVSIIGFDNIEMNEMIRPRLTSVNQHIDVIAQKAMEMLQKMSNGEYLEDTVVKIVPELVIRDSVRNLNE